MWCQVGWDDFRKPRGEVELAEILPVVVEANDAIRNVKSWMKPTRAALAAKSGQEAPQACVMRDCRGRFSESSATLAARVRKSGTGPAAPGGWDGGGKIARGATARPQQFPSWQISPSSHDVLGWLAANDEVDRPFVETDATSVRSRAVAVMCLKCRKNAVILARNGTCGKGKTVGKRRSASAVPP